MPCNCDYMNPSAEEIEVSKMACILDELNGGEIDKTYWKGYHPKVYSQTYDRYNNPVSKKELEAILVDALSKVDVTQYSLEVQMWWRDYQELKQIKIKKQRAKCKKIDIRKRALDKLTDEEKIALGLKK